MAFKPPIPRVNIIVRVVPPIHKRLKKLARLNDETLNGYLTALIERHLAEIESGLEGQAKKLAREIKGDADGLA